MGHDDPWLPEQRKATDEPPTEQSRPPPGYVAPWESSGEEAGKARTDQRTDQPSTVRASGAPESTRETPEQQPALAEQPETRNAGSSRPEPRPPKHSSAKKPKHPSPRHSLPLSALDGPDGPTKIPRALIAAVLLFPVVIVLLVLTVLHDGSSTHKSPRSPVATPTKQAATQTRTYSAVTIGLSDLRPGFMVRSQHVSPGAFDRFAAGLQRCVQSSGLANHSGQLTASSLVFTKGTNLTREVVSSSVSMQSSATIVADDFTAAATSDIGNCLAQAFVGQTVVVGAHLPKTVSAISATPISGKLAGADASFGTQITITMKDSSGTLPVYLDLRAFGVKRYEALLTSYSVSKPFPADLELRLAGAMVGRATR